MLVMRYGYKNKFLLFTLFIIILIILLHPDNNGKSNYESIQTEEILNSLSEDAGHNFTSTALIDCNYYDIIGDETTLPLSLIDGDLFEGHGIRDGGEYAPIDCKPKYSTALIVPYRDRAEQLRAFLVYMHIFLRKQQIHYRIYVVEQVDSKPFNRAKLLNIGAVAAMRDGYPCLVLHDVDLLPLKPSNLYACTILPRHMASSIDTFRYVLPYLKLFGGAISISSKQFKTVNGMSNKYKEWSNEDDDFYARLTAHNINICTFDPKTSSYHKTFNVQQNKRTKKNQIILTKELISIDGLNSLQFSEVATVLHPLFTHIMVDV